MRAFRLTRLAWLLSAVMLFLATAQAMEIRQFDKMAGQDQDEYIAELVQGAEKVLTDEGKPELAGQVSHLFTTNAPGDRISIGMTEFYLNLALLRVEDVKNIQKNPNDPRIEVEDVMTATLQKNHIDLPDSFYTVLSNFKPKFPPK